jgi:hypothetical protein
MATATPLDFDAAIPTVPAEEVRRRIAAIPSRSVLSPADQAELEHVAAEILANRSSPARTPEEEAWLAGVHQVLEDEEREHPDLAAREREVFERYGKDRARELADLEAGWHPYQRP